MCEGETEQRYAQGIDSEEVRAFLAQQGFHATRVNLNENEEVYFRFKDLTGARLSGGGQLVLAGDPETTNNLLTEIKRLQN